MKFNDLFRSKNGKRPLFVRVIAIAVVVLLVLAMVITMLPAFVFADEDVIQIERSGEGLPLVVDAADILTDSEEAELEAGLRSFKEEQDFDIVVLTVESLGGYDVVDYADIFYDNNGYGGGSENDGALILVSTEYRDWTMITSGYGITAITDYSLDEIEEEILPDLSSGNFSDAFKKFGDHCAYCVREARAGNIIDEYIPGENESSEGSSSNSTDSQGAKQIALGVNAGIGGVIGLISSWLINGRRKGELKSVRYKTQAKEYVRMGSLDLTENRDRYLYKTVSRVPINRVDDDDDRGHFRGSTIHLSPGGKIHGGGRPGKF